jgi:hypothetical protein
MSTSGDPAPKSGESGAGDVHVYSVPSTAPLEPVFPDLGDSYHPAFMFEPAPMDPLDHLDPEETFDALFGEQPTAEAPIDAVADQPDLATMKVAKAPRPTPLPFLLPPSLTTDN